jgi:site-specific recombinase XerD
MTLAADPDLKGLRDRALLLFGFAGAFRRSEIVALDCEDLEATDLGFKVTIRHSKTDQEGLGQTIAIVRGSVACPVRALRAWLDAAGITTGPIFRSVRRDGHVGDRLAPQSVAQIVKGYAERAGFDPVLFAGHSLRAGFLTSAAKRGASVFKMMDQSRHRSVETLRGVMPKSSRSTRAPDFFEENRPLLLRRASCRVCVAPSRCAPRMSPNGRIPEVMCSV